MPPTPYATCTNLSFFLSSYDFPENPNLNQFGVYQPTTMMPQPQMPYATVPLATMQPIMPQPMMMPQNAYSYGSHSTVPSIENFSMNEFNKFMQQKKEEFFMHHMKNK